MSEQIGTRTVAEVPIITYDEVGSTQIMARELLADGYLSGQRVSMAPGTILGVVASRFQSAGRGRRDRTWESIPGSSMTATFIVKSRVSPSMADVSRLQIAACEALRSVNVPASIKWPNDIIVRGATDKKLGGCLTEIEGDVLLVGIGINLTSDAFGNDLADIATSVKEQGTHLGSDELADLIVHYHSAVSKSDDSMWDKYRQLCVTLGSHVRIEQIEGTFEAEATDINVDGSLVVRKDDGATVNVREGDVVHLRNA